jgi:hypothetical protein
MPPKKAAKKVAQLSYRGHDADGLRVNINATYLLDTLRAITVRERQGRERDEAAQTQRRNGLIQRRDRLAYDDVALENFNAGDREDASTSYRHDEFLRLRWANAHYEDFFFYQNPINRWNRIDSLLRDDDEARHDSVANTRQSSMFDPNTDRQYLLDMLDYYDYRGIGNEEYRRNLRDIAGVVVRGRAGQPPRGLIGPNELPVWTPMTRRAPGGLRNAEDRKRVLQRTRQAYDMHLDEPAIVAELLRVESVQLRPAVEGQVLNFNTHAERRADETRTYWSEANATLGRPSTSNERQNEESKYTESFGQIRTEQGVFIAANVPGLADFL